MGILEDLMLDRRDPAPQFAGPEPAKVLRVEGAKLVVALESMPAVEVACSWSKPAAHAHTDPDGQTGFSGGANPPAGTRCLVLFAGLGAADPWVVAFSGWPA